MEDARNRGGWTRPPGVGTSVLRLLAWVSPTVAKYTHGSIGLISNPAGEVLLVTHRGRERGQWSFPGGTHGPHEDPRAALLREVHEETRVSLDSAAVEFVMGYTQPWSWHFDHVYVGEVGYRDLDRFLNLEVKQARFVDLSAISDTDLTVATKYAIHQLRSAGYLQVPE